MFEVFRSNQIFLAEIISTSSPARSVDSVPFIFTSEKFSSTIFPGTVSFHSPPSTEYFPLIETIFASIPSEYPDEKKIETHIPMNISPNIPSRM